MAHNTTVFRQLLDLLPRHEFDAEAQQHQEGQRLRVMSRWAQFVRPRPGTTGRPAEPARHRRQPARPTPQALSPGRASVRQSFLVGAGERTAAVYALRSALRTPAGPLPAAGSAAWLPVQEQAVRGGRVDHRLVSGGLPVGVVPAHEGRDQAARRRGPGGTSAGRSSASSYVKVRLKVRLVVFLRHADHRSSHECSSHLRGWCLHHHGFA